jgi:TPP-dependent 2-oxoacid decarboxylase
LIARRPVVLDVPVDLLSANVEHIGSPPRPTPAHTTSPAEDALDHALGVSASARRPLVLAGRGAVLAEAARNCCCSPTRWVHRSRQPFWHMTSSVANRSISACTERSRSRWRSKSWPNPTA